MSEPLRRSAVSAEEKARAAPPRHQQPEIQEDDWTPRACAFRGGSSSPRAGPAWTRLLRGSRLTASAAAAPSSAYPWLEPPTRICGRSIGQRRDVDADD